MELRMMNSVFLRRVFWFFNKVFMVPAFRLGLGSWTGNPVTGYMMVLKTIGRKTGKVRYTPVNYAIMDGYVYCLVGFGRIADWFRNLQSHPKIESMLPSGPIAGVAEEVTDQNVSLKVLRQVLKNAGFAGFFLGINPFTSTDEELQDKARGIPVIRIKPTGVGSGPGDAGGWKWILEVLIVALVLLLVYK
jgi:deazaflavin-dependent oxidoreductase (nitroreductase family)